MEKWLILFCFVFWTKVELQMIMHFVRTRNIPSCQSYWEMKEPWVLCPWWHLVYFVCIPPPFCSLLLLSWQGVMHQVVGLTHLAEMLTQLCLPLVAVLACMHQSSWGAQTCVYRRWPSHFFIIAVFTMGSTPLWCKHTPDYTVCLHTWLQCDQKSFIGPGIADKRAAKITLCACKTLRIWTCDHPFTKQLF